MVNGVRELLILTGTVLGFHAEEFIPISKPGSEFGFVSVINYEKAL